MALVLLLAAPLRAEAHARLMGVLPAPSSTVPAPLRQVLLEFNEPIDRSLFRARIDTDSGAPGLSGQPVFQTDRTILLPLRRDLSGVLVISWVAIGTDAHPVQGQFVVGVRTAAGAASLASNLSLAAQRSGSFESGAGSGWLSGAIEAARAVEIVLLYTVLGLVLVGALLLGPGLVRRRGALPAGPGAVLAATAPTVPAPAMAHAGRALLAAGLLSVALVPLLFWLEASRITELIAGVGIDRILLSTIGAVSVSKALLWTGVLASAAVAGRRAARGRPLGRPLLGVAVLSLGLAAAFVAGTHVGTGSAGPGWLYIPMMMGHVLLTAFWAGGLVALLLVVFPSRDPARIWAAVSRYSRVMTVSVVLLIGSGLLLLLRLLNNLNALWCTSYGLVAGFKVTTVVLALVVGLVNNRLVAAHRRDQELPETARRMMRRTGPSIRTLQRVVLLEAGVLLGVLVLAAVLGESQLPPLFNGRVLPGDAQDVVQSGLFGSGCR
ncbi:MAG TPA: CopD family protein [Candidatus Dormibacteraeota bacterium]|jgi:putative copper export protein/methionine-rich copper-binding protein CopC